MSLTRSPQTSLAQRITEEVINVTGSVIGAILGDLANGVLSISQTLFNFFWRSMLPLHIG
ncbi:MAG: hypothetical protein U5K54_18215 [Cytophagales bacterium]|nr:hypothetical protein [Cytophagales bacterium]